MSKSAPKHRYSTGMNTTDKCCRTSRCTMACCGTMTPKNNKISKVCTTLACQLICSG